MHVLWRVRGAHLENGKRVIKVVIAELSPVFLSCRATGITTTQASVNVPETYFRTFIIRKGNESNYPLQQEKLLKHGSAASDKQTDWIITLWIHLKSPNYFLQRQNWLQDLTLRVFFILCHRVLESRPSLATAVHNYPGPADSHRGVWLF